MKVTFLGTAAAHSCPLPFCGCGMCKKAREYGGKDLRKRSSLLVNDDLLIDLGPDFMSASYSCGLDTTKIRYLLQTHSHSDHFGAGHLITRMAEYATQSIQPLTICASARCIRGMSAQLDSEWQGADLTDPKWRERLRLEVREVEHAERLSCGRYSVTALSSGHDDSDGAYLYLVSDGSKTLFYALDADYRTLAGEILDYLSDNRIRLKLVVLDHTYGSGVNADDHLDSDKAATIVKELKRRGITGQDSGIFASHISHEGNLPHEEFVSAAKKNGYDAAFDGLALEL